MTILNVLAEAAHRAEKNISSKNVVTENSSPKSSMTSALRNNLMWWCYIHK